MIIQTLNPCHPGDKPVVLTLGNFDGVHVGHRRVLKKTVECAKRIDGESVVITFARHTRTLLSGGRDFHVLTTPEEKAGLMRALGVNRFVLLSFTPSIRRLTAARFLEKLLIPCFNPREIVFGYDHRFGKDRADSAAVMERLCEKKGIRVHTVSPCRRKGRIISSTLVRETLVHGRFKPAVAMLGGGYPLSGRVIHGEGRGRQLGFPTANIFVPPDKLLPTDGVYFGIAQSGTRRFKALMSLGVRPTFQRSGQRTLEVYLADFKGNLYGKNIILNLLGFIRAEQKFESPAALIIRMKKDLTIMKNKLKKEDSFGKAE